MSMLTMKTIMQTFSEMIEEMPFDKITVLALVKRCEINHNTFYYHFQDLYELLDKWIQYEIDKLVKTLEDPTDLKAEMKAIFQACKEYPKIINHILSSLSKEQLEYRGFNQQIYQKAVGRCRKISFRRTNPIYGRILQIRISRIFP